MPYNKMCSDSYKTVDVFSLFADLMNTETGEIDPTQSMKNIAIGSEEELDNLIESYKASWNADRKDGMIWVFRKQPLGSQTQKVQDADDRIEVDEEVVDKEFTEFAKDVFGADNVKKEGTLQYYMYVPGRLKKAEFEEGMNEFCERLGCSYELIDQTPEAPSRQYFSENMKLMYPDVKKYEILANNERKLELAKELFKEAWGQEFDPESEDDKEDIVLLYNEYMEELREWKPVEVRLIFPEEGGEK